MNRPELSESKYAHIAGPESSFWGIFVSKDVSGGMLTGQITGERERKDMEKREEQDICMGIRFRRNAPVPGNDMKKRRIPFAKII